MNDDLVERLRERANDKRPMPKPFNLLLDAADRISQQDAELERVRREVEEARAALKPFAERAARFDDIPGIYRCNDNVELWQDGNWRCDLTVGDLRKARSAIAVISEAEEART